MADTVTRSLVEELVVVAVTVGSAGSAVGVGVGETALGVAAGGVVAVGDGGGCVAAAVGISTVGSVADTVVATACGAASLPACGGGGAGSVVQASSSATGITMMARKILNLTTPWDALGSRANGGNCPTRPVHRQ